MPDYRQSAADRLLGLARTNLSLALDIRRMIQRFSAQPTLGYLCFEDYWAYRPADQSFTLYYIYNGDTKDLTIVRRVV